MTRTQYDEEVRPTGDDQVQSASSIAPAALSAPVDLTSPIEYDAEPIRVPVRYKNRHFILTESGDAVLKFRNACLKAARFDGDGNPVGMDGLADAEAILVQGCLLETDANHVPLKSPTLSISFVRNLPTPLLADLFARAKQINHVGEKGEDKDPGLGKDSPPATTDGYG